MEFRFNSAAKFCSSSFHEIQITQNQCVCGCGWEKRGRGHIWISTGDILAEYSATDNYTMVVIIKLITLLTKPEVSTNNIWHMKNESISCCQLVCLWHILGINSNVSWTIIGTIQHRYILFKDFFVCQISTSRWWPIWLVLINLYIVYFIKWCGSIASVNAFVTTDRNCCK